MFYIDAGLPPVLPSPRPLYEAHYLFICLLVCLCRRTILMFPTSSFVSFSGPIPSFSSSFHHHNNFGRMSPSHCHVQDHLFLSQILLSFQHVSQQSPFFKHVLPKQRPCVSFYHLPPLDLRGHLLNYYFLTAHDLPVDHQYTFADIS